MIAEKYPAFPILLVDDEVIWLNAMERTLMSVGISNIITCSNVDEVYKVLAKEDIQLAVLDLNMPGASGEELLKKITDEHPDVPVIIITGNSEIKTAVRCMQNGAFNYFEKIDGRENLIAGIKNAIKIRELKQENERLRDNILSDKLSKPEAFGKIITANRSMKSVFQYIDAVAASPEPLLITGESGTGKELIASAVHNISGLKGKFVPVNIAGEDDNVLADTLFGHTKGAFTGAASARKGLVEEAKDGTLFLDEIGDLSPDSQIKLLRLIQEHEYRPVGSDKPKKANIRILAATNKSLEELRSSPSFRQDLFYRLCSHHVYLPPLRERKDDIPVLLDHFLREAAESMGKKKPTPPDELVPLLKTYSFPGNIRELRAMVFDAVIRHTSKKLSMAAFEQYIFKDKEKKNGADEPSELSGESEVSFSGSLPSLKQLSGMLAEEALRRCDGNKTLAAKLMGVTRKTLSSILQRS